MDIRLSVGSSKQQEHNDGQYSDRIPPELLHLIFLRLPAKTLAICVCVSKHWASIIRSHDFSKTFHSESRILFLVRDYYETKFENRLFLTSSSGKEEKSTFVSRTECHVSGSSSRCRQPQVVNGLICCGYGTSPKIYNPITGKLLDLPSLYRRNEVGPYLENILGYDPVNDQYKVLSMTPLAGNHGQGSIIPYMDHKVFTLGAQGSWRMIHCNTIHCPGTISICINGVVYYGAYIGAGMKQRILVRFDVRTERFGFTQLPESVKILDSYKATLMNFHGKIALTYSEGYDGRYKLWILKDDEKNEWSNMSFSTRSWKQSSYTNLEVQGITRMGEIILTHSYGYSQFYVVYYNLVTKQFRKMEIDGFKCLGGIILSWEYVENSTMLL